MGLQNRIRYTTKVNKMADDKAEIDRNLKPGIIYFSRLPPFMKPAKVRYLFAQYGEIGRLFLQPEGTDKIGKVFTKGVIRVKI